MDALAWHWLWRETNFTLDGLARAVSEARGLESAVNFARYVRNSGLVGLLKANAAAGPLTVDGALIEWKANELEREALRLLAGRGSGVAVSELESINRKLDLIAGHVSRFGTCGLKGKLGFDGVAVRSRILSKMATAMSVIVGSATASISRTASVKCRKKSAMSGLLNAGSFK